MWTRLARAWFGIGLLALGATTACSATADDGGGDEAVAAVTTASACTAETTCQSTKRLSSTRSCVFVVAFDGSGVYSPSIGSNVGRLYESTRGSAAVGGPRHLGAEIVGADTTRAYIEGVPGVPGTDSAERVDRGRSAICQHLAARHEKCDIVLFGYSRGAIVANQVAHVIDQYGCADGSHRGETIKFIGAFDPVSTQMGFEWKGPRGAVRWQGSVASNVESFLQVTKDPGKDPRGGIEGLTLTTTPLDGSAARSSCEKSLTRAQHPKHTDWNHGEIGHGELPREAMKCALEKAGVRL